MEDHLGDYWESLGSMGDIGWPLVDNKKTIGGPRGEHWGQFDEPLDPEEQSDTIVEAREPEVSRA